MSEDYVILLQEVAELKLQVSTFLTICTRITTHLALPINNLSRTEKRKMKKSGSIIFRPLLLLILNLNLAPGINALTFAFKEKPVTTYPVPTLSF